MCTVWLFYHVGTPAKEAQGVQTWWCHLSLWSVSIHRIIQSPAKISQTIQTCRRLLSLWPVYLYLQQPVKPKTTLQSQARRKQFSWKRRNNVLKSWHAISGNEQIFYRVLTYINVNYQRYIYCKIGTVFVGVMAAGKKRGKKRLKENCSKTGFPLKRIFSGYKLWYLIISHHKWL